MEVVTEPNLGGGEPERQRRDRIPPLQTMLRPAGILPSEDRLPMFDEGELARQEETWRQGDKPWRAAMRTTPARPSAPQDLAGKRGATPKERGSVSTSGARGTSPGGGDRPAPRRKSQLAPTPPSARERGIDYHIRNQRMHLVSLPRARSSTSVCKPAAVKA